jgi:O-acetyl-ADP-ribose deacetylase (regulator of RNase III)
MIRDTTGDLLGDSVDAIVNTVNTEGVMGKGIALQFKNRYPANFDAYRAACKRGEVQLGSMFVFETGALRGPRYIINFPTKGHWRSNSNLADVQVGLGDLVRVIGELDIRSIAVPPLGCGLGGLDWNKVRPMIVSALDPIASLDAHLYGPTSTPRSSVDVAAPIPTDRPKMTLVRAVVVELVRRYSELSGEGVTRLEIHLLAYFAQVAGVPLKLSFGQTQHGPSAENLNLVLKAIVGHFFCESTDEFGTSVIRAHESVFDDVALCLVEHLEVRSHIDRVLDLAEGFESPYALELLSKLHFAASQGTPLDQINDVVRSWSDCNDRLFTDHHLGVAIAHLKALGWSDRSIVGRKLD